MGTRRPKAPSGCFWKGNTLYGRYRPAGARAIKWSLQTSDPAVARQRYEAGKAKLIGELRFGERTRSYDEVVEEWTAHIESAVESETMSAKTARRYATSLQQLEPDLTGRSMAEIDIDLIADVVAQRKQQKVTHATIKRDLNALSSVLNFAVGNRWRKDNPVLAFLTENKQTKLVRERRAPMVLPREQDIALVKARSPAVYAALIDAARKTGAREDELIRAKAEHIDHKHRTLTLIGKRNKQRTITLEPMGGYEFFKAIPAYVSSPYLFWHDEGAKYETFPQQFWRKVHKEIVPYAKANGIDFRPFRFHDLRHLHAVEFLKSRSGTIHELKHRLGHSSITTTEAYLKAGLLTEAEIHWALYGRPMTGEPAAAEGVA
jgi:integrase/recombinase XerD